MQTPLNSPLAHDPAMRWLATGTLVTLVLASLVGQILKLRMAHGRPHGVIDNLNSRIRSWWVMLVIVGATFLMGNGAVVILFGLVSFAALREYISLAYTRTGDHVALALMFYVALPIQFLLIWMDWYGMYSIFIPVHVFLVLPIVASLRGDTTRFLERTAKMQWGLMICVFCLSHVPALLTLRIPEFEDRNIFLVAWLIAVVQGSDVLQYTWGKLLGQHPVAPALSPSKTVEGLLLGVTSATLLGAALHWITPFLPWQAALLAALVCTMGFLGGLVMSAIKRDRGVKDWGSMIEGHGGMLDRLDSVVFAAPAFFHAVRYWWVP